MTPKITKIRHSKRIFGLILVIFLIFPTVCLGATDGSVNLEVLVKQRKPTDTINDFNYSGKSESAKLADAKVLGASTVKKNGAIVKYAIWAGGTLFLLICAYFASKLAKKRRKIQKI